MNPVEVVMNPVRQRIIQFLMIYGKGTVKEIKSKLTDVPTPSMYRHIKILAENAVIVVAEENKVRGTVESVYRLNENALSIEDNTGLTIQADMMNICRNFARYFAGDKVQPKKDMLFMTGCTLNLTDEDYKQFFVELHQVAQKYMAKEPAEGSRVRQVSLISSPCEEEDGK